MLTHHSTKFLKTLFCCVLFATTNSFALSGQSVKDKFIAAVDHYLPTLKHKLFAGGAVVVGTTAIILTVLYLKNRSSKAPAIKQNNVAFQEKRPTIETSKTSIQQWNTIFQEWKEFLENDELPPEERLNKLTNQQLPPEQAAQGDVKFYKEDVEKQLRAQLAASESAVYTVMDQWKNIIKNGLLSSQEKRDTLLNLPLPAQLTKFDAKAMRSYLENEILDVLPKCHSGAQFQDVDGIDPALANLLTNP